MLKLLAFIGLPILLIVVIIAAYLVVRHYHRKWRWDDKMKELSVKRQARQDMADEYKELTGEELPQALLVDIQTERLNNFNSRKRVDKVS